jgi:hypothetical protein
MSVEVEAVHRVTDELVDAAERLRHLVDRWTRVARRRPTVGSRTSPPHTQLSPPPCAPGLLKSIQPAIPLTGRTAAGLRITRSG